MKLASKLFMCNFMCFLFSLEEFSDERKVISGKRYFYYHCVNKMPGHLPGHLLGHFSDNLV